MPLSFDEYIAEKRQPLSFDSYMAEKADTTMTPESLMGAAPQPGRLSERLPFLKPTPNPEEQILIQLLNLGKGAGQLVTELPQFFVKDLPEALAATLTGSGEPGIGTMVKEMTKDTAKVIAATAMRQLNPEEYERWKQTPEGQEVVRMIYEEPLRPLMAPLIATGVTGKLAKKFRKAPAPRPKAKPKGEPIEPILEEVLGFEKPGVESTALEAAKVLERELGATERLAKSPREADLLKRRLEVGKTLIPEELLEAEKAKAPGIIEYAKQKGIDTTPKGVKDVIRRDYPRARKADVVDGRTIRDQRQDIKAEEIRTEIVFREIPTQDVKGKKGATYRGVGAKGEGAGTYQYGKGLYSTRSKAVAKQYGTKVVGIEGGIPKKPLVIKVNQDFVADWLLPESGYKNIRDFNKAYKDPGEFVRSKGYDGVIDGDIIVKYAKPLAPSPRGVKPAVKPQPKRGREPWEMTRDEFTKSDNVTTLTSDAMQEYQLANMYKGKIYRAKQGETHAQVIDRTGTSYNETITGFIDKKGKFTYQHPEYSHDLLVKQALSENKPVPAEVLKDYPELRSQAVMPKAPKVEVAETPKEAVAEKLWLKDIPEEIKPILDRVTYEKGRFLEESVTQLSKRESDAIAQHLVETKHPKTFEAGTRTRLIADYAKEIVGKPKPSQRGAVLDVVKAIREPAGAKRVPYKEAIKAPDRPEMTNMESYYKSISTQKKLTPEQAVEAGIALRQTPTGKIKPAVREAGTFVPTEFSTYGKFKDAKQGVGGGTKDWIRYVQEIDGALSLQKKAKLPGQEGPAEKYILRRQEDISKIEFDWQAEQSLRIKEITKGLSNKQERLVTEVLEETSRPGSYVKTADFAINARIKKITTDPKIVRAAQESRKILEHWFSQQNKLRALRGQELINYRQFYAPEILRKTSLWERAFGGQPKAKEIMRGPQLPDYIKPNKPFNPRELAREIGLKDYMREMRIGKILEDYANTASRDIHHTSIIQNNKAFIQQLETMGYKNAAEGLSNFTAESFGGVKARMDRAFDFPVKVQKGMRYWRGSLMRSVFPFNIAWNTFVQTFSSALTVMRTGITGSTRGLVDWFTNPAMRNRIKGSYSYRVKSRRGGRITRQDINTGVTEMIQGKRSAWQASIDGANYATELIERHLTGWSIASGLRHGAKRGLRGKALWDYASDMGAKTQSMYNLENKPGMLRSETVQTVAPFNTFIFEMYNTAKEFAGKTGTPPGAMTERIGWVLRFTAAVYASNEISHAVTGRRPWEIYSFIPFSDQTIKPVVDALRGKPMDIAKGRGLPSFVGATVELGTAINRYLKTGDTRKLRNWGLKYGTAFMKIPGGTQISRMVDGWIAIADGKMKDSRGRTLFKIKDPWEQVRAISMGPWRTKAGIEYWDKKETGILEDIGITKKKKKALSPWEVMGGVGKRKKQKKGVDFSKYLGAE